MHTHIHARTHTHTHTHTRTHARAHAHAHTHTMCWFAVMLIDCLTLRSSDCFVFVTPDISFIPLSLFIARPSQTIIEQRLLLFYFLYLLCLFINFPVRSVNVTGDPHDTRRVNPSLSNTHHRSNTSQSINRKLKIVIYIYSCMFLFLVLGSCSWTVFHEWSKWNQKCNLVW